MSSEVLLGTVLNADGDPVEVYADTDGVVVLRWEHGTDMVLGRTARDRLRELFDRAAMPGQRNAIPRIVTDRAGHRRHGCPTCLHAAD